MCLIITSLKPKRLKFKNGKITLYKVLLKDCNKLISPYQGAKYSPGWNHAIGMPSQYGSIHGGAIHVYTSKKRSMHMTAYTQDEVAIPVTCYKKDLIAEGSDSEACFSKIFISKKNYTKALKSKSPRELINNK